MISKIRINSTTKISLLLAVFFTSNVFAHQGEHWLLVDNFESTTSINNWVNADVQNETKPFIKNPQVTIIESELDKNNKYLLRKPAAEGVVGNRKAISFLPLPKEVDVGETYTFYTRVNVEYFPNNHSFGLSNLTPEKIKTENYNAFEPMIRITDKKESDGSKNDGSLMVLSGAHKKYKSIVNPETGNKAAPLQEGQWYEIWYVINNSPLKDGGQSYDLYVKGGEFKTQQKVFTNANFRMKREQALTHFMAICNTGPKNKPYGNGGVKYDDIYMSEGLELSSPIH
ncbi:hypothetical protein WNY51_10110 [Pseudocolwellia sp. AS88]|jgi:hypothetical protein|uniref:hypothetical protein n=1 Tax=Pseudocolwellia sp. AS88 TaxID=3063958 RepID=UPI0026EE72BB|nr:hypothetical protein [Pseudocolwellia sp. AS88]MDO7084281.1 hypothetical protein [Pseudocolwellia sp. AS88]